ncbi:hypothetical protein C8T65DRAFT_574429 [Cerioporus squamosus]|nr:hypothetical protein C8T65DRAFT_574429 [Cerioporus squamosus]
MILVDSTHKRHDKKLGHDGFPVVANPDPEPGSSRGYTQGPPPPCYDEATSYEGSQASYAGATSSEHRPQLSPPELPPSQPYSQPYSRSLYGPGPPVHLPATQSSSRAVSLNYGTSYERSQDPYDYLPPPGPPPAALRLRSGSNSFTRVPPRDLTYGAFPPAVLHAHSDELFRGFPLEPPTCLGASQPHPFITHDVNEDDWARFLDDVRRAAGLTPVDSMRAGAAPRVARRGIIGLVADMAISALADGKKENPLAEVIANWNQRFFHPRLMDVVLAQGAVTYTGPEDALPPDMAWRSQNEPRYVRAYDDTYLDERYRGRFSRWLDEGDRGLGAGRRGRRELVGGVGALRRERLAGLGLADRWERADYSRDLWASTQTGEKWRLVVTYKPPLF